MPIAFVRGRATNVRSRPSATVQLVTLVVTLVVLVADPSRALGAGVEVRGPRSKLDVTKLEALVRLELGDRESTTNVIVTLKSASAESAESADVLLMRGGDSRTGSVELRGSADAERAIALFVGELARSDGAPPPPPAVAATPPKPAPAPEPPPAGEAPNAAEDRTEASGSTSTLRPALAGQMGLRLMGSGGAIVFTPHLEGGITVLDVVRLGVLARYGYATSDDPLGTVTVHTVSGGLASTVRVLSGSRFSAWTGPRFEVGTMAGSGDGAGQRTASSLALFVAWVLEGRMRIGGYDAILGVEGGSVGGGLDLRADDRSVLSLSGGFVGLSAGVGTH